MSRVLALIALFACVIAVAFAAEEEIQKKDDLQAAPGYHFGYHRGFYGGFGHHGFGHHYPFYRGFHYYPRHFYGFYG